MKKFLLALQFLTIIPVKIEGEISEKEVASSVVFFPIIGGILGCISAAIYYIFNSVFPLQITMLLIITSLAVFTGGLHLDGFADTLDGLAGGKTKEEKLEIMKDSRIGAMGVIGLIFLILAKFVLLNNISLARIIPILILTPVLSRFNCVIAMSISKSARENSGIGTVFIKNISTTHIVISSVLTLIISILLFQKQGIGILLMSLGIIIFVASYFNKKLGGITGDIVGGLIELSEVITLFLIAILPF